MLWSGLKVIDLYCPPFEWQTVFLRKRYILKVLIASHVNKDFNPNHTLFSMTVLFMLSGLLNNDSN